MDDTYSRITPMFPTQEYRSDFMTEVFELTYYGGGGFNYSEVWNMPVPYRRFNLKKISQHLEKVKEAREEAQGKQTITEKTNVSKIRLPDQFKKGNQESTYVSNVKK
jgi:hypothetical protein